MPSFFPLIPPKSRVERKRRGSSEPTPGPTPQPTSSPTPEPTPQTTLSPTLDPMPQLRFGPTLNFQAYACFSRTCSIFVIFDPSILLRFAALAEIVMYTDSSNTRTSLEHPPAAKLGDWATCRPFFSRFSRRNPGRRGNTEVPVRTRRSPRRVRRRVSLQ